MRRSTKKKLWRLALRDAAGLTNDRLDKLIAELRAVRGEPQTRAYCEMLERARSVLRAIKVRVRLGADPRTVDISISFRAPYISPCLPHVQQAGS